MKTHLALASTLTLALFSVVADAATTTYIAVLEGKQETPPVATNIGEGGSAGLVFDDVSKILAGNVAFQNLVPTAGHIHNGACGVAGGVEITMPAPAGTLYTVQATLTPAQETALVNGNLYVNLHTSSDPNGRVRGQLYKMGTASNCPADAGADSGTDSGTPAVDSGTSSSSSSSTSSSGASGTTSSSGTSGTTSSSGTSGTSGTNDTGGGSGGGDDGGCSTASSGTSSRSGFIAIGLSVLGLAALLRARPRKRGSRRAD